MITDGTGGYKFADPSLNILFLFIYKNQFLLLLSGQIRRSINVRNNSILPKYSNKMLLIPGNDFQRNNFPCEIGN